MMCACYSGQMTAGLVREFLEFFELDFTCSVFDPETNVVWVSVYLSYSFISVSSIYPN